MSVDCITKIKTTETLCYITDLMAWSSRSGFSMHQLELSELTQSKPSVQDCDLLQFND